LRSGKLQFDESGKVKTRPCTDCLKDFPESRCTTVTVCADCAKARAKIRDARYKDWKKWKSHFETMGFINRRLDLGLNPDWRLQYCET